VSDARNSQVEWRDLLALSHREILVELLMPLLALAAALIAGAVRCWPLLVLASAMMFMFGLRVSHGAFHRSLGLRKGGNDAVMFVLSALLGGSMHAIEVTHRRHHRDCLADDDVEGHIASHGFWRALLESPRYPLAIHLQAWRHGTQGQRHWIATELIVAALVQGLIWRSGIGALKGIALTLYAANALAAMPGIWLVHRGCRHRRLRHRPQYPIAPGHMAERRHVPSCRAPRIPRSANLPPRRTGASNRCAGQHPAINC
jgi:fatty acid desaturase